MKDKSYIQDYSDGLLYSAESEQRKRKVGTRSFPKRPYSRVRDSLAIFTLIFLLLLNNIEVQK